MAILVDKNTRVGGARPYGPRRHVSCEGECGLRYADRRRRDAWQRRDHARGLADFQYGARGCRQDGRQRHGDFCAATVRGGRDYGSGRRGN